MFTGPDRESGIEITESKSSCSQSERKCEKSYSSTMPSQKNHSKSTPIATESTQKYQQTSTTATNANTSNTTRLNKTTNPTYSTNADAPNTTRLNKTTDPTYSINAKVTPTFVPNQSTAEPKGSMEEKMTMVISICLTIFIAVALVCTGIVIYIWKRGFKFSSGSSTAVQLNIQSNAVVCTSNATTSNAAEEIEIANSTEENHVYDSVIYTGYQTFQPKTSDDLTETINSNASSISDLSIQPETSESLTESILTSIADQTFQPKTSESQTATVSQTSTCAADQTP
ncbi:uncharacterized protein LOC106050554 isoform X1 [Biomphalaria glabrata]|uniref:Uncharacterized protein LOC106050554 isoform X1 n=1 Tax=Biomphalaria glabrata TaxID=6526 RepID=A0A9W3B3S5_BIOGL|nr:uncharacterized protein LOC106050554 isoform X1 [Biomphalaria glabrata]XP_055894138.1 uncharacterized protein LOC106050554 isoform X1 [Biomphalaria glabrata]XP_055894139.1 uncharacterized protein LOC106050554 isoform X1 [Biomphalaria glabrata]XP_055894141.1 uncharacterized protein LOC106050554 isoform X1 [Biomphalaria glabrata]